MGTWIALLRAVNVGGRKLSMADLREIAGELGFGNVRTLLQSGNLVFEAGGGVADLERQLEEAVAERVGLRADFFVRSPEEWAALIAGNPFPEQAERDPARMVAVCLREAATAEAVAGLQAAIVGRETVRASGRVLYAVYPDGQGTSKLTLDAIERKLRTRGTARNWNTVLKLRDLSSGAA